MLNPKELFDNWKSTILSLSALIVVIPSVINGVNDICVSWRKLPIGKTEKINSQLFKVHWHESPIHTEQFIIEGQNGQVPITVDIYKNGDIFVDYGNLTQWFPYARVVSAEAGFFSSTAYAAFFEKKTRMLKTQKEQGVDVNDNGDGTIKRTRYFSDGSREVQIINRNTGEVISVETIKSSNPPPEPPTSGGNGHSTIEVIKLPRSTKDPLQIYNLQKEQ